MDMDKFQEDMGGMSSEQVLMIIGSMYLAFSCCFHTQSAVFLSAVPHHRCAIPSIDNTNQLNLTEKEIQNYTIPYNKERKEYDGCHRYAYNISACGNSDDLNCIKSQQDAGIIPCDEGYIYDRSVFIETTASQWNLVCDRRYLDSVANSLFFLGFFLGSLFIGPLSDWFGRKIAMLVTAVGLFLSCIACAFTTNFIGYVIIRVFVGMFAITGFIAAFVYASEMSSKKWRTEVCIVINMCAGLAHCVTSGIALYLRNWHQLQLAMTLMALPFFIIYFFLLETPRWLMSQERFVEAKLILQRFAKSKGKTITEDDWSLLVETAKRNNTEKETNRKLKIWDLFGRPVMRVLSFAVMFCWFSVSMVFYGLALNGSNLSGNPYVNITLNAIVEICGYAVAYFSGPYGRKPVLSATFILSGLFCIASMLLDLFGNGSAAFDTASTAFAISGKFFASAVFAVIYSVTAEMYPTEVRSTAISMGSMAARIGGMLSPFIVNLQSIYPWFMQTVFGTIGVLAGLSSLCFPETNTKSYLRTLDEAEEFYWNDIKMLKKIRKRKYQKDRNTEEVSSLFAESDEKEPAVDPL